MGIYHWLVRDQKSAFNWWHEAIHVGETLGARPQLSRTYAEIGIRLCATPGHSSDPHRIRAKEPLEKAKMMFCDLGLNSDLEDLNSVIHRSGLKPSEV